MRRLPLLLVLLAVSLFPARAQTPAPPQVVTPPARTMNLQAALAQISPVPAGITLTVGPQWEDIARDKRPPGPSATVAEVAQLFGKVTRKFGVVRAIAPPTMTLLSAGPGEPNPFEGMAYYDVVPLLAASLTDSQWAALTGEQGLSVAALTGDQQQLFAQLLPDGQLKVQPWASEQFGQEKDVRDLSGELLTARLRLKQTADVMLPIKGEERSYYGGQSVRPSGGETFKLLPSKNNWGNSSDVVYGQRVREVVPNAPKRGQLDLRQPALQTPIPFAGLKTIGDLFARIAKTTNLELYPERRWQHKTLMILGTGQSAPAADLLQAAAFCLSATFRQVGPAYVMTDDLVGLGTKMQRWYEFEKWADAMRQKPLEAARDDVSKRFGKEKLSAFGDPLAMTEGQEKDGNRGQGIPIAQLTPDQQRIVREMADKFNTHIAGGQSANKPVDVDGKFMLESAVSLQLLVPSLAAPIDMGVQMGRASLFSSYSQSATTPEERRAEQEKQTRDFFTNHADMVLKLLHEHPEYWDAIAKQSPALTAEFLAAHPEAAALVKKAQAEKPTLAGILQRVPNRAALVRPRTVEDVGKDMMTARQMGLTQLWVDAFSDGKPHTEMVAEAVKAAKGTGLKVFAALDLLSWGAKPPAETRDLNVLGETSLDALARREARRTLQSSPFGGDDWRERDIEPLSGVAVSPLSPPVRQTLLGVVQSLKDLPELAGIVLRETAPPGYELQGQTSAGISGADDSSSLTLGYSSEMRLAFLRKSHADPIDVFPTSRFLKANTNLPNFMYDASISQEVHGEWSTFRRDVNLAFLRELQAAARPLRVLVRRRGPPTNSGVVNEDGTRPTDPGWYAAWDNPKLPPPTAFGSRDAPGAASAPAHKPALTQARAQSPLVLQAVTSDSLAQMSRFGSLRAWQKAPPPGLVLDAGTLRLSQVMK